MRYLKKFNENSDKEIHKFCEKYINKYTINNGLVDVDGDVYLSNKGLESIPVKFGNVTGYFNCSRNKLTSLEFAPHTVGSYLDCSDNRLTSLEGGPHTVGGYLFCSDNQLSTLEFFPKIINGGLDCYKNKLTSLNGLSEDIEELGCGGNPIADYWDQVDDLEKLEIFLFSDIDTLDGDELCQQKVDFIKKGSI